MKEMQDMAHDFHSEIYFKRYMLTKLALEAQHKAIGMMERKIKRYENAQIMEITGEHGASIFDKKATDFLGNGAYQPEAGNPFDALVEA